MSGEWQVRFEIVAGPNDGFTFAITDEGVVFEGEVLGPPPGSGLGPKDLDDVEVEVGDEGVTLTCEVPFWLNGAEVNGSHLLHDGDIVRVGMTEMIFTGCTGESSVGPEGGGTAAGGAGGAPEGGAEGAASPPPRRCLRSGCGAMNPPDAKWCQACGWDLETPE